MARTTTSSSSESLSDDETNDTTETTDTTDHDEQKEKRKLSREEKKAEKQEKKSRSGKVKNPATAETNPVWFKPLMFGFMLLGLAWIIVFYVSQGKYPVPNFGSWNILVGFGIAFVGFIMTTRWK